MFLLNFVVTITKTLLQKVEWRWACKIVWGSSKQENERGRNVWLSTIHFSCLKVLVNSWLLCRRLFTGIYPWVSKPQHNKSDDRWLIFREKIRTVGLCWTMHLSNQNLKSKKKYFPLILEMRSLQTKWGSLRGSFRGLPRGSFRRLPRGSC